MSSGTTATARRIVPVTQLPYFCVYGEVVYLQSDNTFYGCGPTNTWAPLGTGGSAGANIHLSNLSAVAINTSLLPASSGSADLGSSSFPFGSLWVTSQAAVNIKPFNTSAGNTGELRFMELAANGTNYTGFKAPDALASSPIYTLPDAFPASSGYVLSGTTAGVLSWVAASASTGTIPPLVPTTSYAVSSNIWPGMHVGAGSGQKYSEGMQLDTATNVTADQTWALEWMLPATLPSGTCKLLLVSQANAAANVLKVNPKWNVAGDGEDPSSATLNAEGTTTITWSAGDADDYKYTKITLDASTPTASKFLIMNLVFEDSGMTLAVVSTHKAFIIWE